MDRAVERAAAFVTVSLCATGLLSCSVPSDLDCDSAATKDQVFRAAREQNYLLDFIKEGGEGPARPESPIEHTCADDALCQELVQKNKRVFEELRALAPQCEPLAGDQYDGCPKVDERELAKAAVGGSAESAFKGWVKDYFFNSNVQTWPPENERERFMVTVWKPRLRTSYELATQIVAREEALSKEWEAAESRYWNAIESTFLRLSRQVAYDLKSVILVHVSDVGARLCKAELTASVPGWGEASANIRYSVEQTAEHETYVTLLGA